MRKIFILLFCVFAFSKGFSLTKDLIYIGGGYSDFSKKKKGDFRLEFKSKLDWHRLRPIAGIMATNEYSLFAFGGFSVDFYLNRFFVIAPNLAAGLFYKGNGKDLGFPIEFRSGIEMSFRFKNLSRLGIHFSHISNASLAKRNPGAEYFAFVFAFPLN